MHTKNGLWADVYAEQQARTDSTSVRCSQIMRELFDGLAQYGISAQSRATMMGRNPGFDLRFLEHHAPMLPKLFSHQQIDVCSFQLRAIARFGHEVKWSVPQPHRALPDCLNEIEELKHYEALTQ